MESGLLDIDGLIKDVEYFVSMSSADGGIEPAEHEAIVFNVTSALNQLPLDAPTHVYAASVARKYGSVEEFYRHLAIALAVDPKCSTARVLLACKLAQDGNALLAEEVLERGWQELKRNVPKTQQPVVRARLQNMITRA